MCENLYIYTNIYNNIRSPSRPAALHILVATCSHLVAIGDREVLLYNMHIYINTSKTYAHTMHSYTMTPKTHANIIKQLHTNSDHIHTHYTVKMLQHRLIIHQQYNSEEYNHISIAVLGSNAEL